MTDNAVMLDKALLTRVAERVNELMMEAFEAENYTAFDSYSPSEKFLSSMEKHLRKQRKISKPLKTIFIIAAILAIICGCTFGVAAIRKARVKYDFYDRSSFAFIEWGVETSVDGVASDKLDCIVTQYEPTYIPDGFVAAKRESFTIFYEITYLIPHGKSTDRITFSQHLPSFVGTVDTEDDTVYHFKLNGYPAFCVVDHIDQSVLLYWCDDLYVYNIYFCSPYATMEKVIKMAESLAPVK